MSHTAALIGGIFVVLALAHLFSLVIQAVLDKTFRITNIIFEEALTLSALATFVFMILIWSQYFAR